MGLPKLLNVLRRVRIGVLRMVLDSLNALNSNYNCLIGEEGEEEGKVEGK